VRRAAVSIIANIAEGYDSFSDEEFIRFLRSATEVRSHLYVALDQDYISKDEFDQLYEQANKTKSLISGFMQVST
jgi:four helix bundle protein